MKKLIPAILLLLILVLPCISLASTLGGTVWLDKKLDGVMDGERGLADAQIALLDENGYTLGETKSAKDGTYLFEELGDGVYTLSVKLPSAYVPTIFGLDSQLLPAQGNQSYTQEIYVSGDTTVNLGTTKTTVFFGFVAFIDANQNGGRMKTEETVRGTITGTAMSPKRPLNSRAFISERASRYFSRRSTLYTRAAITFSRNRQMMRNISHFTMIS